MGFVDYVRRCKRCQVLYHTPAKYSKVCNKCAKNTWFVDVKIGNGTIVKIYAAKTTVAGVPYQAILIDIGETTKRLHDWKQQLQPFYKGDKVSFKYKHTVLKEIKLKRRRK